MGRASRTKGRTGQRKARALLTDRDWNVAELNNGQEVEDFIAIDSLGRSWSVEVKMCKVISHEHRKQAQAQAKARRLPWMLVSHIEGTSSWLIQRQGQLPEVWSEKAEFA